MKSYYRIMLGAKSKFAEECFTGSFIGAGFLYGIDLTGKFPEDWRAFNKAYIPIWLESHPEKTRVSAGLACGALWTVAKGLNRGDIVLSPDGLGSYRVGEIAGDYQFVKGANLPHQRKVLWLNVSIPRTAMSQTLQNSTGSIGTVSNINQHHAEIEQLIGLPATPSVIVSGDPNVEDPVAFAMEKHLEDFLVKNWSGTILAVGFDIFTDEGELAGQQYQTDVGPIDILAISKDKKRLLVVELKRGRASDVVVGQLLRYMGYIKEMVAEPNQTVEGVIIALDEDIKLRYALAAVPNATFYRYSISFKLMKGDS